MSTGKHVRTFQGVYFLHLWCQAVEEERLLDSGSEGTEILRELTVYQSTCQNIPEQLNI
jgi:hypothetical protein